MPNQFNIRYACHNDFNEIIEIFEICGPDHWDADYAAKYYRTFFNNACRNDEVFVLEKDGSAGRVDFIDGNKDYTDSRSN